MLYVSITDELTTVRVRPQPQVACRPKVRIDVRAGAGILETCGPPVAVRGIHRLVRTLELVGHGAVVAVGIHRTDRAVHRKLIRVGTHAVTVRIGVCKHAGQQHLIRGETNSAYQVRRGERGLFDLGKEVLWVAVQGEMPHRNERVILLRPGLCQIEGVPAIACGLINGHDLHLHVPRGEIAARNSIVQVAAGGIGILTRDPCGFFVGVELPALAGLEVVLHPETLTGLVNPLIGVRTETIHVTETLWNAAVTHHIGHLVCRLRGAGPEIPLHVGVAQARTRHALLGMNEVRELNAVAEEKHRGVVTHNVVIALRGVKLQGKTTHIAPRVRGALLTSNSGETQQQWGDGAGLEQGCAGVSGHVLGDDQLAESTRTFRVHHALRDALAVKVGKLFNQVNIVQRYSALLALGNGVILAGGGCTVEVC